MDITEFLCGFKETMHIKHLGQCLAHSKCPINASGDSPAFSEVYTGYLQAHAAATSRLFPGPHFISFPLFKFCLWNQTDLVLLFVPVSISLSLSFSICKLGLWIPTSTG